MKKLLIITFMEVSVAHASYLNNHGDCLEERVARKIAVTNEQAMVFVFTPDIQESEQERIKHDIVDGKIKGLYGICPMFQDETLATVYNLSASQTKTKNKRGCCLKSSASDAVPKFTTTITVTKRTK